MKRQFFKKLTDYSAREKVNGKKAFVQYHEGDEAPMAIYGTIVERTGNTLTLGDFVDIHFALNYTDKIRRAGTEKETQTAIKQLEFLHTTRIRTNPKVFKLDDKIDCYVLEII